MSPGSLVTRVEMVEMVHVAKAQHVDDEVSSWDVEVLADGVQELVRAVRTVRQAGGTVRLPRRLVQACRELMAEAEGASGSRVRSIRATGSRSDDSSSAATGAVLQDVPLRRLLWQVIEPGETLTVLAVVDRLAALGVEVGSTKVSNALGYWVTHGRLVRERKGVYTFGASSSVV